MHQENPAATASFGYLKINVAAAQRALPVYNAQIMIYGSIEERIYRSDGRNGRHYQESSKRRA